MAGGDVKTRTVAQNRKARHNYIIEDTLEAGLALVGTEVKSLREGKASLGDAFAQVNEGELYLMNAHIAPYQFAREGGHEPERSRKLLLHRREIKKFAGKATEKGYTLVPLKMYFKRGRAKVLLGLCRGRQVHDKREKMKKASVQRDLARAMRERSR